MSDTLYTMPFQVPWAQQPCHSPKARFSADEIKLLEAHYQQTRMPSSTVKQELAVMLDVDIRKVNNWYQNRRAKDKVKNKQQQPLREPINMKSRTSDFMLNGLEAEPSALTLLEHFPLNNREAPLQPCIAALNDDGTSRFEMKSSVDQAAASGIRPPSVSALLENTNVGSTTKTGDGSLYPNSDNLRTEEAALPAPHFERKMPRASDLAGRRNRPLLGLGLKSRYDHPLSNSGYMGWSKNVSPTSRTRPRPSYRVEKYSGARVSHPISHGLLMSSPATEQYPMSVPITGPVTPSTPPAINTPPTFCTNQLHTPPISERGSFQQVLLPMGNTNNFNVKSEPRVNLPVATRSSDVHPTEVAANTLPQSLFMPSHTTHSFVMPLNNSMVSGTSSTVTTPFNIDMHTSIHDLQNFPPHSAKMSVPCPDYTFSQPMGQVTSVNLPASEASLLDMPMTDPGDYKWLWDTLPNHYQLGL